MFRRIRIAFLLLVLASVAQMAWVDHVRTTSWNDSVQVAIIPVNGDGATTTAAYIRRLHHDQFVEIEAFIEREAHRYGVTTLRPIDVSLAPEVEQLPPSPPRDNGALDAMLWSLQMRLWAWRHTPVTSPPPRIRLFVLFHDPERSAVLGHSIGLEKGLVGVIRAFASRPMNAQNNIVIAHELLHTLGASDKYDPASNLPLFPAGFAEPQLMPTLPQRFAEIMAGRTPLAPGYAEMPPSLDQVVIGPLTATEIRWLRP
ncbi:MAG: hypothetical protein HY778_18230 [Betaproteobacteria bacterium]|nr:hypothetical protein [Betaproteobacteria bacterium]